MLIILYSTNYMLTTLSLPIEVCANSNNDFQSLASDFRLIYVKHFLLLVQVRSTLYFIYPKQRTCFRHLCLHLHHHTPMENLRRYFSHTNAVLLDAHDQKIWCNMFRTIHTTMADFDGPTVIPYPLSLRYSSSSGTTFSLYLKTHEFYRGR